MCHLSYKVCIYISIIMMIYVNTCSHRFNYVQLLVRNAFKGYRRPSSLFNKSVFVVWSLSCRMILYLHILPIFAYVILPIPFYLLICLDGPYNLDEHISAGHNPMSSGQCDYGGPLIGQYSI